MPFIPQIDEQLALKAALPMDEQIKGFEFGQAQTKAQRETQAYTQQQNQQKALRDIFQNADTSTPEGQADLIRQVGRVDPNAALGLQEQFGKTALQKQQTQESKAKTTEQTALAGEHTENTLESRRAGFTEAMGEFLRVGTQIQGQYDSDIKSGILPEKAQQKAVESLNQEKQSLGSRFQGNQDVSQILEKMDTSKGYNPQEATQGLAKLKAMVGQLGQQPKPSESPVGKVMDDFNAGRIDKKTMEAMVKKETNIPVPQAIITSNLLTPDAVDKAADQFNLNGSLPPAISRSPAAVAKILDKAAEKTKDTSGADVAVNRDANKADAKSLANLTKQSDMIKSFESTALKNLDMLVAQSAKVPRTDYPLINKALVSGQLQSGSPEAAKFYAIVKPFVDEYAKILSGQTGAAGASDTARKEAADIISPYFSPEQINALKPFITQELNNRTGSLTEQASSIQKRMHDRVTGTKEEAPSTGLPEGWTVKVH